MPSRRLFPSLLLLVSLTVAGGCTVSDRQIIDQADQAHSGLKPAVVEDRELADYIQAVGDRIVEEGRRASEANIGPKAHFAEQDRDWMFSKNMRFHFVNSKTLNAFTTGGEHMYIYTELFRACKNEDELAAVMAHEYAHIYGRHVQKGTQRQYGVIGLALAAGAAGAVAGGKDNAMTYGAAAGGAAMALGQVAGAQFTRKDEAEADQYGFHFYTRAGWDPNRFAGFFQTMIDRGMDKGVEFLSDHPSLANRVKAAEQYAKDLPPEADKWRRPPVANESRFRQLQERAERVGRSMPNDQTLAQSQELLQALPRSCLTPAVQADQIQANKRLQRDLEEQERRQQDAPRKRKRSS